MTKSNSNYVYIITNISIPYVITLLQSFACKLTVHVIFSFFLCSLGLCTSQDVDIFIRHMNNARYLRELDFARFHFYALTGLYEKVKERHGGAVQGASSVRYRRTIPIFHPYKIQTKLVWWDDKAIYLEQQFITLTDGFVRAVALSKQCITNCNVMDIMKTYQEASKRPEMPEDLKLWLEAIEVSSQKLRKDK